MVVRSQSSVCCRSLDPLGVNLRVSLGLYSVCVGTVCTVDEGVLALGMMERGSNVCCLSGINPRITHEKALCSLTCIGKAAT